jgi:hypothetical protein
MRNYHWSSFFADLALAASFVGMAIRFLSCNGFVGQSDLQPFPD